MLIPPDEFVAGHFQGRLSWAPTYSSTRVSVRPYCGASAYFDMASVDTPIPLHSSTTRVVSAMTANTLVRARNAISARHGGSRALADFQVTPPFGSSILTVEDECSRLGSCSEMVGIRE